MGIANHTMRAKMREAITLYSNIVFGATGAITSQSADAGFVITRNGAGDFTITLDNNYPRLLVAKLVIFGAAAADATWQRQTVVVLQSVFR